MNPNLEEQKIRQLFRDARQADERAAPAFAETLEAAMTRVERHRPRWLIVRVAVAAVAVVVISVSAFVIFRQSVTPSKLDPAAQGGYLLPLPLRIEPVGHDLKPIAPSIKPMNIRSSRHKPHITRPDQSFEQTATLISAWQSPTDFLLKTPGEQWLKTVPRLNESSIKFKAIFPGEKN